MIALRWGYNPLLVIAVNGFFLLVDLVFFAANATKSFEGGWFPLLLAAAVAFLMLTWRRGQSLVQAARTHMRQPEAEFLEALARNPPIRLPGTAVYLTASPRGIPLPLTNFVRHNHALQERLLLLTALVEEVPRVSDEHRVEVTEIAPNVYRVVLHYGFMESPCIPEGVRLAIQRGHLEHRTENRVHFSVRCSIPLAARRSVRKTGSTFPSDALVGIDADHLSYYIGRETIIPTEQVRGMAVWREALFAFMKRNAERSAAYFQIPARTVVEVGTEIEI